MRILRAMMASALLVGVVLAATGARMFDGSSSYANSAITWSGSVGSISAWVKLNSTNSACAVASIGSAANTRHHIGFSSGGIPTATTVNSSGGTTASALGSANPCSSNVWVHLTGVFASSTSRKIYLDGVPVATNTSAVTVASFDRITAAMRVNGSAVGLFCPGSIAELGVWNVALTDAEVASLGAGARPIRVRPASLKFYSPLAGEASPEVNFIGTAATLTNAPTAVAHPRVY